MTKRKTIRLRIGTKEKLAEHCGVSLTTVYNAMRWAADSEDQNRVREAAYELGFVRRF